MKVFLIGGTGLLGNAAAKELILRGHTVKAMALAPAPVGAEVPDGMELELGDYAKLSDDELKLRISGCDCLVFAAGVDERVHEKSIYEFFKKHNITNLKRLMEIAKECGVKHTVICGSYFAHFSKLPERKRHNYPKWHSYIRCRLEQEEMCMSFVGDNFDVAILELPYIFGAMDGREPVWKFVVEMFRSPLMKKRAYFAKGGTAMVTVKQVAQAIAGALEKNKGGNCYPIGWWNLKWPEMLKIWHKHMGCPDKKILTLPTWMFKFGLSGMEKKIRKQGLECGTNMKKFAKLQCSDQFIDKSLGCIPLGVTEDDLDAAIGQSMRVSIDMIEHPDKEFVSMKGE